MSSTTSSVETFSSKTKIFRAGAGAGKTTRLVKEVYDFYKDFKGKKEKNPRVVLTTFTRKATQELRERLMHEAQKKKDYDFLNFVLSKNSLLISTIHGTLQLFLKQYAQKIDLDPGFKLTDEKELFKRAKIILKELLSENDDLQNLLEELTFKDLTTLIIRHDREKKIYPNATYFNMEDMLRSQKEVLEYYAESFLKFSDRIISETENSKWIEYCTYLKGVANSFKKAKNQDDVERALQLLAEFKKPTFLKKNPPFSEELNDEFKKFRDEIKKINSEDFNHERWKKMVEVYDAFDRLSQKFSERFDQWKKSSGLISMTDLELYSYELIRTCPDEIHFFSEGFDYWLIDEFQDTSPLQVTLLTKFINDRNYFVVGDPQQSIYFFRGARVQVFDEIEEKIKREGGELHSLNTNYRSQKPTMSFINFFFKHYSNKFKAMELGGPDTQNKNVATIALASDQESQNLAILSYIQDVHKKGAELGDICILGRKNDQLKKIAEILHQKKIPYLLHAASGFQERREILDALAILKLLVNPHDNFNLIQILRSPWFRVYDHDIYEVVKTKPDSFWNEFLKYAEDARYEALARLKNYVGLSYAEGITHTFQRMLMDTGFFELSYQYDSSGRRESNLWKLLIQLKTEDHSPDFNYIDFIENRKNSLDLEGGAEDSDAVSSIEPNRVQLMTVHMSKGLEFKHVILPFMDAEPQLTRYLPYVMDTEAEKYSLHLKLDEEKGCQSLPAKKVLERMKEEELAESDRLLYVAMTRAKESLFISTSGAKRASNAWFKKIKINLTEGVHKGDGFEYVVSFGPWDDIQFESRLVSSQEIYPKLFDLESLSKKESTQVTAQIEKPKHQKSLIAILEKANYGRLAHQVFESLKYNKEIPSDEETQKAIQYIQGLKEIPMSQILQNGFAEWGFVIQEGGRSIAGQIDLWGKVGEELWIIDYKTGSTFNSDIAFEQLSRYAQALQAHQKAKKIHLVALYPFEEKYFLKTL